METKHLTEDQKEFYDELSKNCNDTIISIEMICFEASPSLFDALGIKLPPGKKSLWAILAYGEKDMYIYVNATETTILGFRVGNQKKQPKEQIFPFASFSSWKVDPIVKKVLIWTYFEKYSLALHVSYISPVTGDVRGTMLLQTQMSAKDTLEKMNRYVK